MNSKATRTLAWCLVIAGAAIVARQWREGERLAAQRGELRDEAAKGLLRTDRPQAAAESVADTLNRLRAEAAETASLQQENERLKEKLVGIRDELVASMPLSGRPYAPIPGATVSIGWSNVGSTTPAWAVETALWAATEGNVAAFAELVDLDSEPEARGLAMELASKLPAEVRGEYTTPEAVVALLSIRRIPFGEMKLAEFVETAPGAGELNLLLHAANEPARAVTLKLREVGGKWKLVVPKSAIERYLKEDYSK